MEGTGFLSKSFDPGANGGLLRRTLVANGTSPTCCDARSIVALGVTADIGPERRK